MTRPGWMWVFALVPLLHSTMPVAAQVAYNDPIGVQSRVFDIAYTVNKAAMPLKTVELWFTQDDGRTWKRYGNDDDLKSPFTFRATGDGLYGFLFIMTNDSGSSGPSPVNGTRPHVQVFVDFTPPIVQLHGLKRTRHLSQEIVQIRWAAIDQHLTERPVSVEYRLVDSGTWHRIATDPIANTGRFDWRIPTGLDGEVEIRLRVRDRGGHDVQSTSQFTDLSENAIPPIDPPPTSVHGSSVVRSSSRPVSPAQTRGRVSDADRAMTMFEEARGMMRQGRDTEAIMRLRDAVRLDPEMSDAFAEMATIFYRMDEHDRALEAYDIALKHSPHHRNALRGSAMILRKRNDFSGANVRLRKVLELNPDDAEVWMNIGDVAVFQGDEVTAREAYRRALESEKADKNIRRDAQKRLDIMAAVSRSYR